MEYLIAAATDIGLTKATNQDSFGIRRLQTPAGNMVFAILCDGMGGLAKGEVASATVVRCFLQWAVERLPVLLQDHLTEQMICDEWTYLVRDCNEKIGAYGKACGISLGTTITAVLLTEQRYYAVHVGDSRLYEITDAVRVLTSDQTVVAREVEQGILTEEQARNDPRKSVLLQCVGASEQVNPDFIAGDTVRDAVYMLCSDGFRHEITPGEILGYLNPGVMCKKEQMQANMVSLIELNKQRQETDNISVVTVRSY